MRRVSKFVFVPALLLVFAAAAEAQPTISSITPNYGGVGPNAAPPTITGTGFSTVQKATRFVDVNNNDVLTGVTCSNATTCTAAGTRSNRLPAGSQGLITVYALVNGVKSAAGQSFRFYGAPTVSSVTPSSGVYNAATPYTLSGAAFTSAAASLPGSTSIYLGPSIVSNANCASGTSCGGTAPSLTYDCCVPQGAWQISVQTPGGVATPYFIYGAGSQTPATPTITGSSASTGPAGGGNTVTITGTNFIPGTQVAVGGFGIFRGTAFTFIGPGGSVPATGVNCASTTTCTLVVPGGAPGPVDIQVNTVCGAGLSPCSGNARPSGSIPTIKKGLYAYPGVKVTPGSQNIYVSENGAQARYYVSLQTQPIANVHVLMSVTPSGATTSPGFVDFTPQNWAEPQLVTVTGTDDGGASGNMGLTVRNIASSSDPNYNGIEGGQAVTSQDNETKNFVVTPLSGLVTTRTGGPVSFTVVLSKAPSATVTVGVVSNDPSAGTALPASLTFDTSSGGPTSWNTPRTVVVTGHMDNTPGVNRDYSIILTSSSADASYNASSGLQDVQVINVDSLGIPTGLSLVRTGPGQATVRFNPLTLADYYHIKYSTTPGGSKTLVASTALSGHVLTGLTPGQQYYFVISALNAAGEANDSAELPFKILPPVPFGAYDGDAKSEMIYYKPNGDWRIASSVLSYGSSTTVSLGGPGYTPVPGDYDGDGLMDVAVYNDATGAWNILKSSDGLMLNLNWGGAGYKPVPGDYDGDGKNDPAVYRVSDGQWSVLKSTSNYTTTIVVSWGGGGYTPIPGQDFDGDFMADIAIYQQATGFWYVLKSSTNYTTTIAKSWGGVGYTLVPGDYDGDKKTDLGLYHRSTGAWAVLLSGANYTTTLSKSWGGVGYLPVPGDFDGDAKIDLGLFEQATGNWYVLLSTTAYTTTVSKTAFGTSADRIISNAIFVGGNDASRASDFEADGKADITVYNSTTGGWSTLTSSSNYAGALSKSFGGSGYVAVPGDYDGDGKTDYGIYQSSTGNWSVLLSSSNYTTSLSKSAGGSGWTPVQGDYDGDGKTDFVAYNTTTGQWFGLKSSANYTTTVSVGHGGSGYTPVVGDFDGDGKTDIGVYQVSTGNWSVLTSSSNYVSGLNKSVGGAGYIPVQGDYDGDGKTDFVVYNTTSGLWYGLKSSTNYTTTINVSWGGSGYTPVKGDYDGDGKTDLATYVVATGNWYVLLSSANYTTTISKSLGGAGYVALPQYP